MSVFAPCSGFRSSCLQMRWAPELGHVPRGFCGATGSAEEVRLVLVVADTGDPHPSEQYRPGAPAEALFESACRYVYDCFEHGKDVFHRNMRRILDDCWPGLAFSEQLRRTRITESVLCSAPKECGPVLREARRACVSRFLARELEVLPNAVVVAVGGKAAERMRGLSRPYLSVGAVAPRGCNQPQVRVSWKTIPCRACFRKSMTNGCARPWRAVLAVLGCRRTLP